MLLIDQGVQRYFDLEAGTDDVSTFLASADQSRVCMNCKRPGHNQRDCPHVIVSKARLLIKDNWLTYSVLPVEKRTNMSVEIVRII